MCEHRGRASSVWGTLAAVTLACFGASPLWPMDPLDSGTKPAGLAKSLDA